MGLLDARSEFRKRISLMRWVRCRDTSDNLETRHDETICETDFDNDPSSEAKYRYGPDHPGPVFEGYG
jgi:hypothetical protein